MGNLKITRVSNDVGLELSHWFSDKNKKQTRNFLMYVEQPFYVKNLFIHIFLKIYLKKIHIQRKWCKIKKKNCHKLYAQLSTKKPDQHLNNVSTFYKFFSTS